MESKNEDFYKLSLYFRFYNKDKRFFKKSRIIFIVQKSII